MKTISDIQTDQLTASTKLAQIQGDQALRAADHELATDKNQLEIAKLANQQYKEQMELHANH